MRAELLLVALAFSAAEAIHRPNGSLRGTKWSIYEGGVRTPLLARWPGSIPAGSVREQVVGLNDLFATLAARTGQDLSEVAYALDSRNMLPLLTGRSSAPVRQEIVVQSSRSLYGLVGDKWKFIQGGAGQPRNSMALPGELYDLRADPAESTNLVDQYPEVASEMRSRLGRLLSNAVPESVPPPN